MNEPGTRHTGPLGSTIHVLRADAETIVELAALDWNRRFRRVCLDPVRGEEGVYSPEQDGRERAEALSTTISGSI